MANKTKETEFFEAFQRRDITTAKRLLRDVNPSSLKDWRTSEGRTCLHVAVLAGDKGLLGELVAKLGETLPQLIKEKDKQGDTALHFAVRKEDMNLVKQLVELDANLCDCVNKGGETPLKMAVSLGFKEAVEFLITRDRTSTNALHCVVELNQVKLVEFLIKEKVDLSGLINEPYQPDKENVQPIDGGDKPDEERPQIVEGDTPLHIAARNKYEHMVNLLVKVPKVDKLALNSEGKTPFEVAREVMEYYESFRIIRRLAPNSEKPRPFMYCAPQVSHKKRMAARKKLDEAYEARRNAELVVAALLAAMTCAAAFTVPGGFDPGSTETEQLNCTPMANSNSTICVKLNSTQMEKLNSTQMEKKMKELGSPLLIPLTSFKLFIIFDCIAFFLSLFVCIMWEMSSELTTGDKMLFMTVNSLVVCCSFGSTSFAFMCAVYSMLERKVETFSWVVLGSLIAIASFGVIAFIRQLVMFALTRARFHRLCGVSCVVDDFAEKVWSLEERWGILKPFRSGGERYQDLITGHRKFGEHNSPSSAAHENKSSSSSHLALEL